MFEARTLGDVGKPEFYRDLCGQLEALLAGERDPIANAANTSALLFQMMSDLNWAGFYFREDKFPSMPFHSFPH